MSEIHILPVGFDYNRLVTPLIRDFDPDQVVLLVDDDSIVSKSGNVGELSSSEEERGTTPQPEEITNTYDASREDENAFRDPSTQSSQDTFLTSDQEQSSPSNFSLHEGRARTGVQESAKSFASKMQDQIQTDLRRRFGIKTRIHPISDLYNPYSAAEELYNFLREIYKEENDGDPELYINVSSMPRTMAFAAYIAAAIIGSDSEEQTTPSVYYSIADEYLGPKMLEVMKENQRSRYEALDELTGLVDYQEDLSDDVREVFERQIRQLQQQHARSEEIISRIERDGFSSINAEAHSGPVHVDLPLLSAPTVSGGEVAVLEVLEKEDSVESIKNLAEQLANLFEEEYSESTRNWAARMVTRLHQKGFVEQERSGRKRATSLTSLGKLWISTHDVGKQTEEYIEKRREIKNQRSGQQDN